MVADAQTLKGRLRAHVSAFLARARTVRTALQIVVTAAPVAVAALKAIPTSTLTDTGVASITILQFVLLAVGAAAGLLVLLTDRSALALMADVQSMTDQLDEASEREEALERYVEQLEWELAKVERLALTIESMRVAIDVALPPAAPAVEAQVGEMLDLLVVSKTTLFGMEDEQWNFSVYLWRDETEQLDCIACRRPARADEEAPHRIWKLGEGHVGKAFQMRRALICADSTDPNVRGFFDAPEDKRADYDDALRYRSLAAIPFQLPGAEHPIGVVVATSDVAGRFKPTAEGDDDESVRPIRALGKTLATLFGVTTLRIQQEQHHAAG